MQNHFVDMINLLITEKNITLFAPANVAFEMVNKNRMDKVNYYYYIVIITRCIVTIVFKVISTKSPTSVPVTSDQGSW